MTKVSSKTPNIFGERFDCYADALYKYLDAKGLTKRWLAENITPKGIKVKSTQEKFSSWKRECATPSKKTRNKIDEVLGVRIYLDSNGKWAVSRTENKSPNISGAKTTFSIDQLLKEERSRLGIEDIPDTERGRELQGMLDDAVSLVLKLRRSIEKEKRNHSDDDL